MKSQTSIPLLVVLGAICTWCAGLSVGILNNYSEIGGLTASVGDIKQNTKNFPTVKAEVDWLVLQKGYKITEDATTTTTALNE